MDTMKLSLEVGLLLTSLGILKLLGEFLNEFATKIGQLIQHLASLDSRIDLLEYKVQQQSEQLKALIDEVKALQIAKTGSQQGF